MEAVPNLVHRLVDRSRAPADPVEANLTEPPERFAAANPPGPSAAGPTYVVSVIAGGTTEAFYQPASSRALLSQMMQVIAEEGPIAQDVLFRRVARAWGLERTGSRIVERLEQLMLRALNAAPDGDRRFYWPPELHPETWRGFRIFDGAEPSRRHIDEVTVQEIANIAAFILEQSGSTTQQELARGICRTLGMARTPIEAEQRAVRGVEHLIARGRATREGGRILPR